MNLEELQPKLVKMDKDLVKFQPKLLQMHDGDEHVVDCLVGVLNKASFALGHKMTLGELSRSREYYRPKFIKVSLWKLRRPYEINGTTFIQNTIEKVWNLDNTFGYCIKFLNTKELHSEMYYYFETIFSQRTSNYPIPQITVSVFFKLKEKLFEPIKTRGVPLMFFRVEGQHSVHDIRHVLLTKDQILGVMMAKYKLFKFIENINMF